MRHDRFALRRSLDRRGIVAAALGAGGLLVLAAPCLADEGCGETKLLAQGGSEGDQFGSAVSIDGAVAIVGAWLDDRNGDGAGSAAVYRFAGDEWTPETVLLAPDGARFDAFGGAVSISGDVAIVGARGDDQATGSAYLYRLDGAGWHLERKLQASDGGPGHEFGISVAIDSEVAVVGARKYDEGGAAYVYRFDGVQWVEEARLSPEGGTQSDEFGIAVSIDGDRALVGARGRDGGGAAFVYRFDGETWAEEGALRASDGSNGDQFGISVAIDGDVALVGANGAGSAYVYRFAATSWTEEARLTDSDDASGFGVSVAARGGVAVVGARLDDDKGPLSGSAYVYRFDGASWNEAGKVLASDGRERDQFGVAVALSRNVAIVGAWQDDDNGRDSGSAYVYELTACLCFADVNGDGLVGFGDVVAVLVAWGAEGGPEDIDGSGFVGTPDIVLLLQSWGPCR